MEELSEQRGQHGHAQDLMPPTWAHPGGGHAEGATGGMATAPAWAARHGTPPQDLPRPRGAHWPPTDILHPAAAPPQLASALNPPLPPQPEILLTCVGPSPVPPDPAGPLSLSAADLAAAAARLAVGVQTAQREGTGAESRADVRWPPPAHPAQRRRSGERKARRTGSDGGAGVDPGLGDAAGGLWEGREEAQAEAQRQQQQLPRKSRQPAAGEAGAAGAPGQGVGAVERAAGAVPRPPGAQTLAAPSQHRVGVATTGANPRFKNVTWEGARGKYRVAVHVHGKRQHLGYFSDGVVAARAADLAQVTLKEGAVRPADLNFPAADYAPGSQSRREVEELIARAQQHQQEQQHQQRRARAQQAQQAQRGHRHAPATDDVDGALLQSGPSATESVASSLSMVPRRPTPHQATAPPPPPQRDTPWHVAPHEHLQQPGPALARAVGQQRQQHRQRTADAMAGAAASEAASTAGGALRLVPCATLGSPRAALAPQQRHHALPHIHTQATPIASVVPVLHLGPPLGRGMGHATTAAAAAAAHVGVLEASPAHLTSAPPPPGASSTYLVTAGSSAFEAAAGAAAAVAAALGAHSSGAAAMGGGDAGARGATQDGEGGACAEAHAGLHVANGPPPDKPSSSPLPHPPPPQQQQQLLLQRAPGGVGSPASAALQHPPEASSLAVADGPLAAPAASSLAAPASPAESNPGQQHDALLPSQPLGSLLLPSDSVLATLSALEGLPLHHFDLTAGQADPGDGAHPPEQREAATAQASGLALVGGAPWALHHLAPAPAALALPSVALAFPGEPHPHLHPQQRQQQPHGSPLAAAATAAAAEAVAVAGGATTTAAPSVAVPAPAAALGWQGGGGVTVFPDDEARHPHPFAEVGHQMARAIMSAQAGAPTGPAAAVGGHHVALGSQPAGAHLWPATSLPVPALAPTPHQHQHQHQHQHHQREAQARLPQRSAWGSLTATATAAPQLMASAVASGAPWQLDGSTSWPLAGHAAGAHQPPQQLIRGGGQGGGGALEAAWAAGYDWGGMEAEEVEEEGPGRQQQQQHGVPCPQLHPPAGQMRPGRAAGAPQAHTAPQATNGAGSARRADPEHEPSGQAPLPHHHSAPQRLGGWAYAADVARTLDLGPHVALSSQVLTVATSVTLAAVGAPRCERGQAAQLPQDQRAPLLAPAGFAPLEPSYVP